MKKTVPDPPSIEQQLIQISQHLQDAQTLAQQIALRFISPIYAQMLPTLGEIHSARHRVNLALIEIQSRART